MTKARDLSQVPNASLGFKNRIINGDMRIDQRNAGASVTPTVDATYTLDRWMARLSASSKYSVQQNQGSVTPPSGYINYLGTTSLSAYSVSSTDYFGINQRIEGFNVADLDWGTANAQPVTLSFRIRSSLTGTFGGSLVNSVGTRSYPFIYTISSSNTWTTVSITIVGDTTGTWLTTNGIGLSVFFGLGAGSTYTGTAGAWSGSLYFSATGATSVVGTNGATFYITGVQLEKGSTATSFDYRPYGTELALCQRYYELCLFQFVGNGAALSSFGSTQVYAVNKRTSPTIAQVLNNVNFTQQGVSASTSSYLTDTSATLVYRISNATFAQFSERFSASAEL
jgi:hypothetical protein